MFENRFLLLVVVGVTLVVVLLRRRGYRNGIRIMVGIVAFLIMPLSCSKIIYDPFEWPCYGERSSLSNGWPAHCARITDGAYANNCVADEHFSHAKVGLALTLRFPERPDEPVPLVYLGVRDAPDFDGAPIWGRMLEPGEWLEAPDGRADSGSVWGLPAAGTHVYRLPGAEIEVEVDDTLPETGCRRFLDVIVPDHWAGPASEVTSAADAASDPVASEEIRIRWTYAGTEGARLHDECVFCVEYNYPGVRDAPPLEPPSRASFLYFDPKASPDPVTAGDVPRWIFFREGAPVSADRFLTAPHASTAPYDPVFFESYRNLDCGRLHYPNEGTQAREFELELEVIQALLWHDLGIDSSCYHLLRPDFIHGEWVVDE